MNETALALQNHVIAANTTQVTILVLVGVFILIVIGYCVLWYHSFRQVEKILRRYKEDMETQRCMYSKNVTLVKKYNQTAEETNNLLHLVVAGITRMTEKLGGS